MAKISKMRWNDRDRGRLKEVVSAYNKKLGAIKKSSAFNKSSGLRHLLPENANYTKLTKIKSRRDFNREINKMLRFINSPNHTKLRKLNNGEVVLDYTYREAVIAKRTYNMMKNAQIKRTGDNYNDNNRPTNINLDNIKADSFKKFIKRMEAGISETNLIRKQKLYKDNFLLSLQRTYNSRTIEYEIIKRMLDKINLQDFNSEAESNKIFQIDNHYLVLENDDNMYAELYNIMIELKNKFNIELDDSDRRAIYTFARTNGYPDKITNSILYELDNNTQLSPYSSNLTDKHFDLL